MGYGNCGVKLVAVCVVNEVALGFREVPEEACGAVPAWVVDDGWAGCKESLHHPDMVEVQDIVGLLVVVATDEEGSQGEVAIRNGVGHPTQVGPILGVIHMDVSIKVLWIDPECRSSA